jgi:hypothetical protein
MTTKKKPDQQGVLEDLRASYHASVRELVEARKLLEKKEQDIRDYSTKLWNAGRDLEAARKSEDAWRSVALALALAHKVGKS